LAVFRVGKGPAAGAFPFEVGSREHPAKQFIAGNVFAELLGTLVVSALTPELIEAHRDDISMRPQSLAGAVSTFDFKEPRVVLYGIDAQERKTTVTPKLKAPGAVRTWLDFLVIFLEGMAFHDQSLSLGVEV